MKHELLSNNVTLAELRKLREVLREKVGDEVAISIEFALWQYANGGISEHIGVYYAGTHRGTQEFSTLKEAHDYVKSIGKEKN